MQRDKPLCSKFLRQKSNKPGQEDLPSMISHCIVALANHHAQDFLTLYALMDSSFWFDATNLGWSIVYTERSQVIISIKMYFLLKIVFVIPQ